MMKTRIKMNGKLGGTLLMLAATFLWGSSFVVTKGTVDRIPPFTLVAARMLIGGGSVALLYWRQMLKMDRKQLRFGKLMGVLYGMGMILQTYGIQHTSAGRSAFLTAAYCILMPFLEWMVLKHRPERKTLASALICMIGIGLVALNEAFTVDAGDLLTLAGSVCFAMQIVVLAWCLQTMPAGPLNATLLLAAGVFLGVIAVFAETPPADISTPTLMGIAYLSVVCTGLPLLMQSFAQRQLSPTVVTVILGFESVFAAVLSAVVYHEAFTARCLLGFALIFASVFISEVKWKRNRT